MRSTARGQLDVPHLKTSTYERRAFSFASQSAWNSLSNYLKDSSLTLVMFKRSLKTFCFQSVSTSSAFEMLHVSAVYEFTFTFTLHYGKKRLRTSKIDSFSICIDRFI